MKDITKCPWCGGSLDDYALNRIDRHECQNCLFSISKEDWDLRVYYQKEIDAFEDSVMQK